jgi:four helix bundle protein
MINKTIKPQNQKIIAEGFERGSKREFIKFLYIAKGSLGEMRSQLQVGFELGYISKENQNMLLNQAHDLSNQLGAFIASIKKELAVDTSFIINH